MGQFSPYLLIAGILGVLPVLAEQPSAGDKSELDALSLADDAKAAQQTTAGPWRVYLETAGVVRSFRDTGERSNALRASMDVRFDAKPSPGWRVVLSNRLDLIDDQAERPVKNVNSLREAFISWSRNETQTIDFGRVNVRHGAALGYNPTDWFKENALRGMVSPDPAALRENRLGTVVLRGQQLWPEGAITLTFSPRLQAERAPDPDAFSLDLGSSNPRHRWLLASSWRVAEGLTPEVLIHGGEGSAPQLGLNLSALAGDSIVVFGEAAIGKSPTLAAMAGLEPASRQRQQRVALGFTYTSAFNLSLTLETEYNSAAPSRAQWHAMQASGASATQQLMGVASSLQELPTRRAHFMYLTWKDAVVRRVDVSAFVRQEALTHSRTQWLEIRRRWDRADLSLQLLLNSGSPGSVYGAFPLRRALEAGFRWYL